MPVCWLGMRVYKKRDFPVDQIRRFMEPGPVVLVSSTYKHECDIMAMGWHMVMQFNPSLIGCFITSENHSYDMIRKSRECVINIPTVDMIDTVVRIGNTSGTEIDKFESFNLTARKAAKVNAPLIEECFANFECKIESTKLLKEYGLFIFRVVKAHVATSPRYPETVHYRGDGVFMVSGKNISRRRLFRPGML